MFAATQLTAKAASQRTTVALERIVEKCCSHHVLSSHAPIWTGSVTRRWVSSTIKQTSSEETRITALQRWKKCCSRLYARRILEIAAASAASRSFVTKLEDSGGSQIEKPSYWKDWERKDWTEDLIQEIGDSKWARFWSACSRILQLSVIAAPLAVLLPAGRLLGGTVEDWSWQYSLFGIEQAGPTFIKFVQWATTRQDMFSPEFCLYFGKLQDNTEGHPWSETEKILRRELGQTVLIKGGNDLPSRSNSSDGSNSAEKGIIQLEREPIGSGCIAQVYRGALLQPVGQYPAGTELAVKVQHPGIWRKVCLDFYLLNKVASFLEDLPVLNLRYLSLVDTVRQFRDMMLPQMDLTLEASHLRRFNRDFASEEQVSFPRPLSHLTTEKVLTETFIEGRPIMEFTSKSTDPELRKNLAYLGLETTLKMIFLHDFLHGDLHPGNILVSESPDKDPNKVKLHLLDCGLVVEMGPDQHVNVVKILGAFCRRDARLAAELMVDASSSVQASPLDVELFCLGIEQICMRDQELNFIENVGDYITDICYSACRHRVKLEACFINASLAVEIVEGIATALYPDILVAKSALPLIVQAEVMHRLPKFSLW